MDNIRDVINSVLKGIEKNNPHHTNTLEKAWAHILSKEERKHTRLAGEKSAQLLVYVDSPAWLYQINTKKNRILKQVQIDCPHIKDIRLKIGKVS